MEAYTGFAENYDRFMDETPYEEWLDNLKEILNEHGIADGLVLDLGCGTGKMTRLLRDAGYDMIGVDNSEEMLQLAREENEDNRILYLLQDMREFELYGTIRAIVSVADSVNYLEGYEDLVTVLKLANNYLDPKGIFVFDLKTEHYYRDILGDNVFADNREDASLIWENSYYEDERVNEYMITIYSVCVDGRYERMEETHLQYAFSTDEVVRAVGEAGMVLEAILDAETMEEADENAERIYIICREQGK